MPKFTLNINKPTLYDINIVNNLKVGIPLDYIKTAYYTDIKNKDGSFVYFQRDRTETRKTENLFNFTGCDLLQKTTSKITVELITGTKLTTTNSREFEVV